MSRALDGLRLVRTVAYLRFRGVSVGALPVCRGRLPVVHGRVRIGRRFRTRSVQSRIEIGAGPSGTLVIGDDVFVNQGCNVWAERSVRIGSHVRFGDGVTVYDTDFHPVRPGATRVAPVVIEDNVWVGRAAIVLPGVTVGRHSVVAAGAVVVDDVPPRSVVAGNPARVVGTFECADDWVRP
jgi:acetyltransferase-like isoleucine patch superfamily enzyme